MSGQSISDRLTAAKHSISGQGLAKACCKATTEEVMGPKKKHVDYLIQCTHEPNVSIPQLANLLIERTQNHNWVVVFKGLVTLHNLMNYGNERFTQYLASNNCTLNLSNFIDKTGVQGYDMSTYIRRYAKYINEKAYSYRTMAFDFCKVKRGKKDGLLRTMQAEKLLKTLPTLQRQLDVLVEFDVTANELTNGVVNAAFMLLFKDLIRLFACYNDGIINLLEKFFDMQKKQAREALEIYKRFLARMERCAEFLKVAESVGIDKGDIPDLAKAPSSLLEALEEHLKALDGQKKGKTEKGSKPVVAAGITSLQSPTSPQSSGFSEDEKRKIIEEENRQLEKLKEQKSSSAASSPVQATARPIAAAAAAAPVVSAAPAKFSEDLLGLGFGDATGANFDNFDAIAPAGSGIPAASNPFNASQAPVQAPPPAKAPDAKSSPSHMLNGNSSSSQQQQQPAFISDANFAAAFGDNSATPSQGFDSFGAILQPHNQSNQMNSAQPTTTTTGTKLVSNDIDSSLASLAGNLTVGPTQVKTTQQWGPVTEKKLTGGNTWQNTGRMASSTMAAPMSQPMGQPMGMGMYNGPNMHMQTQQQFFPTVAPSHGYMNGQPIGYGNVPSVPVQPMGQPGMQPMGQPGMPPMGMQPMGGMYVQPGMGAAAPMGFQQPRPPMQQQQQPNPQDPFGAL